MKIRILSLLFAFVFLVLFPTSTYALGIESDEFIIYESELKNASICVEGDNLITLTTASSAKTELITRALSDSSEYIEGTTITTVALLVNDPNDTYEIYNELLTASNDNSSYKTNGDTVAGLKIHSTVYYTTQVVDGYEWYRLIRVTGGNDKSNPNSHVIGSGFVISNQHVKYGVTGPNLEGLSPAFNSWFSYEQPSNTASSFDINVESLHPNWPTVCEFQSILGATYTVTIHCVRDDSDIVLELVNNPLVTISVPTP